MNALPEVHSCSTREEMIRQCDEVHRAIVDFLNAIPDEYLRAPAYPEGWTPVKNMEHITRSNRLFARWIGMSAWLLKLFGKPAKPELKIEDMRPTNRPLLFDYGSYPNPVALAGKNPKSRLADDLLASGRALNDALMKRTEEELDSRRGAFGGMKLRTFHLFAVKHAVHHANVVRSRLKSLTSMSAGQRT